MPGSPDPSINVVQGSHQFQLDVSLQNNTTADIASDASLEFNRGLFLNGNTLTKTGGGTMSIRNDFVTGGGTLNVAEGTVSGNGTVGGDLSNAGGIIVPDNSPGILTVNGDAAVSGQVPEPGSLVLLVVGGLLMVWSCGRRN